MRERGTQAVELLLTLYSAAYEASTEREAVLSGWTSGMWLVRPSSNSRRCSSLVVPGSAAVDVDLMHQPPTRCARDQIDGAVAVSRSVGLH
jgi:hypothetical protein